MKTHDNSEYMEERCSKISWLEFMPGRPCMGSWKGEDVDKYLEVSKQGGHNNYFLKKHHLFVFARFFLAFSPTSLLVD